jgi:hypothetical protein
MVNISSNLILCNVTVHVIDLVVNLGITRKCGDNIKRIVTGQVVNMTPGAWGGVVVKALRY